MHVLLVFILKRFTIFSILILNFFENEFLAVFFRKAEFEILFSVGVVVAVGISIEILIFLSFLYFLIALLSYFF